MKSKLPFEVLRKQWRQKLLLPFCLLSMLTTALQAKPVRDISGRVTDEKGEGLPGVTILVKGTTVGTTTNAEGNFTISPPAETQILIVSFVGFITKEVAIGSATSLNI